MPETQEYTISHTGSVVETANLTRSQNQVSPQRETEILSFECPDNFDQISYVAQRDSTRFKPRAKEVFSGDGSTTTFSLSGDIIPVAGEESIADQPYPVVVAAVGGSEVSIASVDYAANSVTLDSAPASGTDNVQLFPIVTEGTLKFRGLNALDQNVGPVYPWGFPLYRWHDMKQDKRGTEVNLAGSVEWGRNEKVQVLVDSPRQIVWTDSDYPAGQFVSQFEQDVEITF